MKRKTRQQYLTFKKIKQRYRVDIDIDYFNHPFDECNTMKLLDDINLEKSLSELSLSDEFIDASDETINQVTGKKKNAINRLNLDENSAFSSVTDSLEGHRI